MIIFILILVFVTLLALAMFTCDWEEFFLMGAFLDGLAVLVIVVLIVVGHLNTNATEAKLQQKYEALKYKVENESYRDEFGLRDKDVIDEIQEWNEDISFKKAAQKDFWIGVFYPNIYDQFELIDYDVKK